MSNIFEQCPVLENERWLMRFVKEEDADDLLLVYGDKQALPFFNSDNCHEDNFYYDTKEKMDGAIRFWLDSYRDKWFVRLAIVDKKIFSKIKNNPDYHPKKMTALCLCIGAKLNLDESKDLLARAGYALSPCDKTDIIFSYFIENKIYDMIELDIQLEEHGLPCIIS